MNRKQLLLLVAAAGASVAASEAPPSPFEAEIGGSKAAMMADPSTALVHAQAAERVAAAYPDARARDLAVAKARWLEGEALTRVDRAV